MSEETRYLKVRFPEGTDVEAKRVELNAWLTEHVDAADYDDCEVDPGNPLVIRYWALCGSSDDWDSLCEMIESRFGAVATGYLSEEDIDPYELFEV